MNTQSMVIAGNGTPGSNTHRVFQKLYGGLRAIDQTDARNYEYMNAGTFDSLFEALLSGQASSIIVPVRNVIIGPVKDVARIMGEIDTAAIKQEGEEIGLEIYHALIGGKRASLETVKKVYSYTAALEQCKDNVESLGLKPVYHPDTYGAAIDVIGKNAEDEAAIAPIEAAKQLGGVVLKQEMSDIVPNITYFKVFSRV